VPSTSKISPENMAPPPDERTQHRIIREKLELVHPLAAVTLMAKSVAEGTSRRRAKFRDRMLAGNLAAYGLERVV
jgi:hypothetical protein